MRGPASRVRHHGRTRAVANHARCRSAAQVMMTALPLATLMNSLRRSSVKRREGNANHGAVIDGIDAEIGVTNRFLDPGQRTLVEGRYDHQRGFRRVEGSELVNRGRRTVIVGKNLIEHRWVGSAGPNT